MLQHFEKCDYIKQFITIAFRKLRNRERKDSLQTEFLFCKARGVPVEFDSAHPKTRVARNYQKITCPAADIQEGAASWR